MKLLSEPVLIVRQEWRAYGRPPEYDVFDRRWDQVARARYVDDEEVRSVLAAFGLRHRTADALRTVDPEGRTLFTVVFPGFRARAVMLVQDAEGRHVGEAVKTKGHLRPRYELTSAGRPVGAVQVMDRRQRLVSVLDPVGEPVAAIRTGMEGAPFPVPEKSADGYYLETLRPMPHPLGTLVVAVAVALQAAVGSETRVGETVAIRLPMIPPALDRLRRRFRA
ncbi:MAG TPA: hypothetical protein VGV86_11120 [Acidimicrobiales bacterium]|nr:hypothetical protein [Acidimicrobiales bacterium]